MNFANEHGNTPLHYACFWSYNHIAEDLVHAGAIVSIANKYGHIPLEKGRGLLAKQLESKYIFFIHLPHFLYHIFQNLNYI